MLRSKIHKIHKTNGFSPHSKIPRLNEFYGLFAGDYCIEWFGVVVECTSPPKPVSKKFPFWGSQMCWFLSFRDCYSSAVHQHLPQDCQHIMAKRNWHGFIHLMHKQCPTTFQGRGVFLACRYFEVARCEFETSCPSPVNVIMIWSQNLPFHSLDAEKHFDVRVPSGLWFAAISRVATRMG